MRIALDAMGTDQAPSAEIAGALIAADKPEIDSIILVGRESVIREEMLKAGVSSHPKISIVHADEVIGMDESPAQALKQKKNCSILVAMDLVKRGEADALVSAGNTGAVMGASLFTLGRLPGISRPAISGSMPTLEQKPCIVVDIGANVDCRPQHLLHFAIMGKVFSERVMGQENPTVGLLSIGEEKEKGNDLTSKTYELLEAADINFIGNVEGKDIPRGKVDVVVCDGFVGNILLKFGEGFAEMIMNSLKAEMAPLVMANAESARPMMDAFSRFKKKVDYAEYGGAPLMGINGTIIICHGRSNGKAIANAIRLASQAVIQNVNQHIADEIKPVMES